MVQILTVRLVDVRRTFGSWIGLDWIGLVFATVTTTTTTTTTTTITSSSRNHNASLPPTPRLTNQVTPSPYRIIRSRGESRAWYCSSLSESKPSIPANPNRRNRRTSGSPRSWEDVTVANIRGLKAQSLAVSPDDQSTSV